MLDVRCFFTYEVKFIRGQYVATCEQVNNLEGLSSSPMIALTEIVEAVKILLQTHYVYCICEVDIAEFEYPVLVELGFNSSGEIVKAPKFCLKDNEFIGSTLIPQSPAYFKV